MREFPLHDRVRRLPALRRRQGHRRGRGQARGPHADRRRDAVRQVRRAACRPDCRTTGSRCRSPTNRPATSRSSPTASTPTPAAGRSSPSTGPKNCSGWSTSKTSFAGNLRQMPPLDTGRLVAGPDRGDPEPGSSRWPTTGPASLIQMATGSGKTYTAVLVQLPAHQVRRGQAHPVPGRPQQPGQADATTSSSSTSAPYNGYKFTEEYNVQHLRRNTIDPASQGLHHHHPAALLDAQGRRGVRRRERGRLAVRGRHAAGQGAAAGRLQPSASPSRRSTSSSSTNATARSTTSGGRCSNTSTPSSSA